MKVRAWSSIARAMTHLHQSHDTYCITTRNWRSGLTFLQEIHTAFKI